MRGWKIKSSTNPYFYEAEKAGFRITSADGRKFDVRDPDGKVICEDMGTSMEAYRLAEAAINRATPMVQPPFIL